MRGYVIACDGPRTGSQAFRADRAPKLMAALEMFYRSKCSMEPHPDVTEWRVWECGSGRDITMQLVRERETACSLNSQQQSLRPLPDAAEAAALVGPEQ